MLRLERSEELLRHSSKETIRRLSYAAEFRDHETAEHIMNGQPEGAIATR